MSPRDQYLVVNFPLNVLIVLLTGNDSFFLESGHGEREREREREREKEREREGGGSQRLTEFTAGVNFVFSGIPNHAEEGQARLELESKCKSEESSKAHRIVSTSSLDPTA